MDPSLSPLQPLDNKRAATSSGARGSSRKVPLRQRREDETAPRGRVPSGRRGGAPLSQYERHHPYSKGSTQPVNPVQPHERSFTASPVQTMSDSDDGGHTETSLFGRYTPSQRRGSSATIDEMREDPGPPQMPFAEEPDLSQGKHRSQSEFTQPPPTSTTPVDPLTVPSDQTAKAMPSSSKTNYDRPQSAANSMFGTAGRAQPQHAQPLHFEPHDTQFQHAQPPFAQSQPTQFQHSQPQHAQAPPFKPQGAQPQHVQPQHAQPQPTQFQHSQPQHAQAPHFEPRDTQFQHAQPQHAQPQPTQFQHSQPQHAQPPPFEPQGAQFQHAQPQHAQPQPTQFQPSQPQHAQPPPFEPQGAQFQHRQSQHAQPSTAQFQHAQSHAQFLHAQFQHVPQPSGAAPVEPIPDNSRQHQQWRADQFVNLTQNDFDLGNATGHVFQPQPTFQPKPTQAQFTFQPQPTYHQPKPTYTAQETQNTGGTRGSKHTNTGNRDQFQPGYADPRVNNTGERGHSRQGGSRSMHGAPPPARPNRHPSGQQRSNPPAFQAAPAADVDFEMVDNPALNEHPNATPKRPASQNASRPSKRRQTHRYDDEPQMNADAGPSKGSTSTPPSSFDGIHGDLLHHILASINKMQSCLNGIATRVDAMETEMRHGIAQQATARMKQDKPSPSRKRQSKKRCHTTDSDADDESTESENEDEARRSGAPWVQLQGFIRDHLCLLLGIKDLSPEEMAKLPAAPMMDEDLIMNEDGEYWTEENFRLDFTKPIKKHLPNESARRVFAKHFLKAVKKGGAYAVDARLLRLDDIMEGFDRHMPYVKKLYKDLYHPVSEEHLRADARRNAMNARKSTLYQSRLKTCRSRRGTKRHRAFMSRLNPRAMSADETDSSPPTDPDCKPPPKRFRVIKPEWQSGALRQFLMNIDDIRDENWNNPSGQQILAKGRTRHRSTPGNPPRKRVRSAFSEKGNAPVGLHRNCYSSEYLAMLRPWQIEALHIVDEDYDFSIDAEDMAAPSSKKTKS